MVSVSGMRGVFGAGLTPEVVARYTAAFLRQILTQEATSPRRFIVGRDGRLGSSVVRDVVTATARAAGCDIIDVGVAMTPTIGVMVQHHGAIGGVVVTASHNPQQWCGVKPITRQGGAPGPGDAAALCESFERGLVFGDWACVEQLGDLSADETASHVHVARALAALESVCPLDDIKAKRYRVAVDSVNASGANAARLLLDALGCDVYAINDKATGVFPHPPEPVPAHLGQLVDAVKDQSCDVGFAQDPDGDRLVVIDASGQCIGEERTLVIAVWAALSAMQSARGVNIAVNLSTSRMVEDIATRFGAVVSRASVGEANVVQRMGELGAPIGGEGNGGVIWPQVARTRDSVSAMALTLALMTRERAPMRDLAEELSSYAMDKRKFDAPEDVPGALGRVADVFADAAIDTTDGVRVDLSDQDGWLHVRASNTEPIVRVIAEAPTSEATNALIGRAEKALLAR